MKFLILASIVILSLIGIVGVQESDALWFAKSPQELLKQSHTIIVGNVTAKQVLEITRTTEIGANSEDKIPLDGPFTTRLIEDFGDSKLFEITYVSHIDEITIDIEEYLQNFPVFENTTMNVRAPNFAVGIPVLHHEIKSKYELGDRVLLYFTQGSLENLTYDRESFVIPEQCDSADVLTQERFWMHNGGYSFKQDDVSINKYGMEGKPLQIDYRIDTKTLDGKRFDIPLNITKIDVSPPVLIFNGTLISESQPCEWITTSQMEINLESGEYLMNYLPSNKENNLKKIHAVFFDVKSDTFFDSQMSPFKQIKNGINPLDIICKEGLQLIFKSNNSPACVTESTTEKLIQRGWTS